MSLPKSGAARPKNLAGWLAALALVLMASASAADPLPMVQLRTLDKITARVGDIEVAVGQTVALGPLSITVRACDKRPPEELPESAAFLEIDERLGDEGDRRLFTGWMFASSPALNALQHPIYDVWVIDCISEPTSASGSNG